MTTLNQYREIKRCVLYLIFMVSLSLSHNQSIFFSIMAAGGQRRCPAAEKAVAGEVKF